MANKFSGRFAELIEEANKVEADNRSEINQMTGRPVSLIDLNAYLAWKTKARDLISVACGPDSEHYKQFEKQDQEVYSHTVQCVLKATRSLLKFAVA